jgi:hypothetical protein
MYFFGKDSPNLNSKKPVFFPVLLSNRCQPEQTKICIGDEEKMELSRGIGVYQANQVAPPATHFLPPPITMFGTFAAPVVIIERRQAAERICISYPNPRRVWVCGTAPPRLLCPCVRSTCSLLAPIVRPTGQRSRGPPSRRGLRRGIA